jgi:hypothetical protein
LRFQGVQGSFSFDEAGEGSMVAKRRGAATASTWVAAICRNPPVKKLMSKCCRKPFSSRRTRFEVSATPVQDLSSGSSNELDRTIVELLPLPLRAAPSRSFLGCFLAWRTGLKITADNQLLT